MNDILKKAFWAQMRDVILESLCSDDILSEEEIEKEIEESWRLFGVDWAFNNNGELVFLDDDGNEVR